MEPPMQSLIFTTPRAGHSPATDEHSALRASRGGGVSTPGSRYLSQQNANRSGGMARRHGGTSEGAAPPTGSLLDDTAVAAATPGPPHSGAFPSTGPQRTPVAALPTRWYDTVGVGAASQASPTAMFHAGSDGPEWWVTVFGFPPTLPEAELKAILRDFQKCGEIKASGSFSSAPANWIHICYGHADEAVRALNRNGQQMTGNLIIGVKPLDPLQRASVTERRAENPPISMFDPTPAAPYMVTQQAPRPYLMAKAPVGPGTLSGIAPEASVWTKISHYVLGA